MTTPNSPPASPPPETPAPASPRSGRAASGTRAKKENWTILDLLRWTTQHFQERGIETARLDAECLLAFALGVERMRLYLDFDKPVTQDERAVFRELVGRRGRERVPVAQLVGRKEFWSLSLRVAPGVLAPRPETETLVAAALELLPDPEAEARVLDVGTGSGAVALAIAGERPRALLTATDVSPVALEVARENAEELGLAQRIRLLPGSLFEPVQGERFDLVVSNPPYVAESLRASLPPELDHEPPRALFAGPDGLGVLLPLLRGVGSVLAAGGRLALELSPEQAPRVVGWCREAGLLDVTVRRDLAGRPRVVTAKGGD
ncbi:MAG: peptide chain release factor N(5)-glutamine methyltransferase [Deltaproteobacteria bacterium]|nr:peptide chain release factor N(5)-glutamine methyltransferase [Deltaproteobacteria bacterium]